MIIEAICNLFFGVANFFVSLLPKFPSFSELNASLSPLLSALGSVNSFISLRLVGVCMMVVFVIYNIKFGWSLLMWVIRKIPGVS